MNASSPFILPLFVVMLTGAACGDSAPPTSPSAEPTTTTEVYVGTMAPGGSGFYSFRVVNPGSVSMTLASLTASSGSPVAAAMQLGMGVPVGVGCAVTTSVTAAPGLRTQLTSQAGANIHCVQLSDLGNLTAPVAFGVRIVHP
jgi:hypothetical protein